MLPYFLAVQNSFHQLFAIVAQLQQEKGRILPEQLQKDLISLPLGKIIQEAPAHPLQIPFIAFLHEEFTAKSLVGCVLIGAGTLVMVM